MNSRMSKIKILTPSLSMVLLSIIVFVGGFGKSLSAEFKKIGTLEDFSIIAVYGPLVVGDHKKFLRLALNEEKAVVAFHSPGGNLHAGIEIGKIIHLKEFDTAVVDKTMCASACAVAWLAGVRRFMAEKAMIGFHAAHEKEGAEFKKSSVGNALIGAYLSKIGLGQRAIIYITRSDPASMQWLSVGDAKSLGISVLLLKRNSKKQVAVRSRDQIKGSGSDHSKTDKRSYTLPIKKNNSRLPSEKSNTLDNAVSNLRSGMRYITAQEILISSGWQPFRYRWQEHGCSPGREEVCRRFPEADSCSGTGMAYCKFHFTDQNNRNLFVVTIGEDVGALSLDRWWIESPQDNINETLKKDIASNNIIKQKDNEIKSISIIYDYHKAWSESDKKAINFVRKYYADKVMFYGKYTSYDKILREKIKFTKRWPIRIYNIIDNTINSNCNKYLCTVSGIVRWRTYSRSRYALHKGTAEFIYDLNVQTSKITRESGKNLSIKKYKLQP